MQYEFALVVDRDASEDPHAETLFELGEGDYVPEGGPLGNVVHVAQDAATLAAAIIAAIHLVEKAGVKVAGVQSDDLATLQDIANRTGRSHESVRLLAAGKRGPGSFPGPSLPGKPAFYSWVEVTEWFADNYGTETGDTYDRELAAADHLVRARKLLAGDKHRAEMAQLVDA
ncbi:hypothetical protein [Amycolatopsis pithecellobii]|uniref:DNA-binding protein n=1 Tax=Amycolatopsis pithecellobii TaxID=664692 RepID=A0A6N7Z5D4_9PSEU|nr:hypothetical protein [Amycolatopsis pithecellobii]MTD55710.1 hypothetical protein [Amycolatopsis pithecellobii]